jgi:hypothetical protein
MDNPYKMIMWANVNAMYQYWQFSKNMLDVFFPVQVPQPKPAPVVASQPVPAKRRIGCIGPADLRS